MHALNGLGQIPALSTTPDQFEKIFENQVGGPYCNFNMELTDEVLKAA